MRTPVGLAQIVRGLGGCRVGGNRSAWKRGSRSSYCRYSSTSPSASSAITIDGHTYPTDSWLNTPPAIQSAVARRLHLQPCHPISLTRQIIESRFPNYATHNSLFPVVSVGQNFDSLGFPADHVGRSRSDTYYINETTVLRTHTSAHQADIFRANESAGFLISADVYRRDAVDRSHYPVFHQMEGARTWDRSNTGEYKTLAEQVWADVAALPKHDIEVEDPNPTTHEARNPLQTAHHSPEEVEAMATHLKRSLENVVVEIFAKASEAAAAADTAIAGTAGIANGTSSPQTPSAPEPLRIRWVEAYFPFTSPSWELEVWHQGDWLEVLGCGIVSQPILNNAGVPGRVGWAFGVGLERIAMLLFGIPDIRLFWSRDERFLSQFAQPEDGAIRVTRFVPFSKHPATQRDLAFWLASSTSSAAGGQSKAGSGTSANFHENDVMEIVRDAVASGELGDVVESVRLTDEFVHPKTGRKSLCYRIVYRSLERTLTRAQANELHERIRGALVERLGVELR